MITKQRTKLLRNIFLPLGDLAFGQRMIQRLKFLERAQFWGKEELLDRQAKDLQRLIQTAYNEVPLYRDMMRQKGVLPTDIQSADDLAKLPVVTKQILTEAYPDRVTRETGQRAYESRTSGSTGKNFVVLEDAETAGWYRASFLLALEWSGWNIGDPHLQTGMTLTRSIDRRLKDMLLNCHYVSAYQLDDANLDAMLAKIDDKHLKYAWGYPGSIYYLAKRAEEVGWDQPLNAVSTWGDSLYPGYRNLIERTFKCRVYDTYGCAEGFQVSAQCEHGNYHIHALDVIVEYLDDNNEPVQEGEVGNLVITRLHPGPMPLIRYKVGDLGNSAASLSCDCGRELPLMKSIQGRNADMVLTPSGNRLIVHYFTGILEHFSEIDTFQIEQDRLDHIIVRIVPNKVVSSLTEEKISQALKDKGARDLEIDLELVESIPLSPAGKHKFVINTMIESWKSI